MLAGVGKQLKSDVATMQRSETKSGDNPAEHRQPLIKTILIEDIPFTRKAFTNVINNHPRLELTACAASHKEGLEALSQPYDLLITDLDLGDGSGLDFIAAAAQEGDKKIIVITVLGDVKNVMASIEAGADGYILKSAQSDELESAITTVLDGGAQISASVAGFLLKRIRQSADQDVSESADAKIHNPLTSRETDILTALARGYTNKEVAQRESISPHTVAEHVKSIYRKLGVHSRSQAITHAYRGGLIPIAQKDDKKT